jgi:hypothetical protein
MIAHPKRATSDKTSIDLGIHRLATFPKCDGSVCEDMNHLSSEIFSVLHANVKVSFRHAPTKMACCLGGRCRGMSGKKSVELTAEPAVLCGLDLHPPALLWIINPPQRCEQQEGGSFFGWG